MTEDIQEGICGTKKGHDGDEKITLDIPGGDSFTGTRVVCPHLQGGNCAVTKGICEIEALLREIRLPAGL